VLLLGVALVIWVSLMVSVIDKLQHSTCGAGCGYTIDKPTLPNPLDKALLGLAKVFPLDYILFALAVVFLFLCAVSGMVSLGIRLAFVKLWSVRAHHTMPNALLMGCWILMFVALALNMEILTFSPQYATFGSQFYYAVDNTTSALVKTECTVDVSSLDPSSSAVTNYCVMSQVARFISLINIQLPFFGVILFFANLIFLATSALFLLWILVCGRRIDYAALKEDEVNDMFYGDDT